MNEKFYILKGDWSNSVSELLQPLPTANHHTVSLTRLHDPIYWITLEDSPPAVVSLDFRHWHYDDATFHKYAKKIASIPFPAVRIFDSPFGFEKPPIENRAFQRKVYERVKILSDLLHHFQPTTVRLSPFIRAVSKECYDEYVRFFIDNRNCFDEYSFDTCHDMNDHSYGFLSTFLHQVLKILHKPIWALWSIPCCDHVIECSGQMNPQCWKGVRQQTAVGKALQMFESVEKMAGGYCTWFITDSQDFYHPQKRPEDSFWQSSWLFKDDDMTTWQARHFTGLVDYQRKPKEAIIRSILDARNRYVEGNS